MLPSSRGGVATAMKITSERSTAVRVSVVKLRRPLCALRRTISSSPGSKIGISPAPSARIFSSSLSTHVTLMPNSAKQAPVTSPTYPVPMTAMFILSAPLPPLFPSPRVGAMHTHAAPSR